MPKDGYAQPRIWSKPNQWKIRYNDFRMTEEEKKTGMAKYYLVPFLAEAKLIQNGQGARAGALAIVEDSLTAMLGYTACAINQTREMSQLWNLAPIGMYAIARLLLPNLVKDGIENKRNK
jgi:hypothetical protein